MIDYETWRKLDDARIKGAWKSEQGGKYLEICPGYILVTHASWQTHQPLYARECRGLRMPYAGMQNQVTGH